LLTWLRFLVDQPSMPGSNMGMPQNPYQQPQNPNQFGQQQQQQQQGGFQQRPSNPNQRMPRDPCQVQNHFDEICLLIYKVYVYIC